MKANASDYYKWPEESSIVSGTCYADITGNGSLFTEIVVTNKKIILKNQEGVLIIYLSSVTYVNLFESEKIYIHYIDSYQYIKINNNAAWADQLFEAINDAVSKIK